MGFAMPTAVASRRGELLPRHFTLTPTEAEAVCFLWRYPDRGIAPRYPPFQTGILPCGVWTFLPGENAGAAVRTSSNQG